jgi:hypothetical protein
MLVSTTRRRNCSLSWCAYRPVALLAPEDNHSSAKSSAGAAGTQRTLALNPILCISLAEISASNICLAM